MLPGCSHFQTFSPRTPCPFDRQLRSPWLSLCSTVLAATTPQQGSRTSAQALPAVTSASLRGWGSEVLATGDLLPPGASPHWKLTKRFPFSCFPPAAWEECSAQGIQNDGLTSPKSLFFSKLKGNANFRDNRIQLFRMQKQRAETQC